jgi:glyceraldehyde-3-phosphate dehydrogenase/erythrose-4-phosphate dehydrogenase
MSRRTDIERASNAQNQKIGKPNNLNVPGASNAQNQKIEPEEDYSRNASCTLMSIYTFLLCQGELISRLYFWE